MGSVREFPRKSGANLASPWRASALPGSGPLKVRALRLEECAAVSPFAQHASLAQLESRVRCFPEGQMVAVADGVIVGAASSLVVQWDNYGVAHTWKSITGDGYFSTHDARGRTLYGADVAVFAAWHGAAVARSLLQARRRLCRKLNLRRIIATARLAGYRASRENMTPELYAMRVVWGDIADIAMRFQLSQGFQYCGILHGYQPADTESAGCAALFAWLNPLYTPSGPPGHEESQRQSA